MKGPTEELLNFVMATDFRDLPDQVVRESKRIVMDSIGVAVAALESDKGRCAVTLAKRLGGGPESAILGTRDRLSCANAAFANGELINALDFDAYSFPLHPPPSIIPAPLAIGETVGASGKDLILAVALGYEISLRLAVTVRGLKRVFSSAEGIEVGKITGTKYPVSSVGATVIAGAAGAGKVLKLDRDTMARAIGLAAHYCPIPQSKWRFTSPIPMTKYISSGWVSLAEVVAVLLAGTGYTADTTPLDGELGWWRYFGSGAWNPEALTEKLGSEWRMLGKVEYKPYPCWGDGHLALDCFIKIINENSLRPEDIESVKVQTTPSITHPRQKEKNIRDHMVAQFSLPYVIAVAANRIDLSRWQDPETIKDKQILGFMDKVMQEAHPDFAKVQAKEPYSMLTSVEVKAKGKVFQEQGKYNRGFEMTDDELRRKCKANLSKVLPSAKVDRAMGSLIDLDKVENIGTLVQAVTLTK
ncbi:MAG: MmgE/PrpD family protein [Chloroflexi bacterium]|nr:MmgE/PrpD family protein [Chloroflexota bacterium]